MVWNWEIFDDNLINVAQFRAGNSSWRFARSQTHESSAYLSGFQGTQTFARPDALKRITY